MTADREGIRDRHDKDLESSTRFGAWSLEKYKHNEGYIVFHWICGRWIHTFYNESKNCCPTCLFDDQTIEYPDELEQVYRVANFDLMNDPIYNASCRE